MATNDEIRAKDVLPQLTDFRDDTDGFYGDGSQSSFFMKNGDLMRATAQNALVGNAAPAFDPTRTSDNPYKHNETVVYNGKLYRVQKEHYGAWNAADFYEMPLVDYFNQIIFDGSIADTSNAEKVRTLGLPFANRTKFSFFTDRPLDEGHYYQFGYVLSDDEDSVERSLYGGHQQYHILAVSTARNATNIRIGTAIDLSAYPTAKVIAIEVTEKDAAGNTIVLRKEDFAGYCVGIKDCVDVKEIYDYVDNSEKRTSDFFSETEIKENYPVGQILQGTISVDGSYSPSVTNRVCSGVFCVDGKLSAKFSDGYKVLVRYYLANGTFAGTTEWQSTNKLVVFHKHITYARFVFAKTDDSDVTPSDFVGVLDTCDCYVAKKFLTDGEDLIDISAFGVGFRQGGLSSFNGNGSSESNSDSAYYPANFFAGCFDRLRFKLNKSGYALAVFYYDFNSVYKGRSDWARDEVVIDIDENKCRVKVLIVREIKTNEDIPSSVYSAVKIYSTKASEKSRRCVELQNRIFGMNGIYFPKISGHRGSTIDAPENSIPSFTRAGQRGYWACESDISKTSDGKYIMFHDSTVNRCTNGSGTVNQMTFAQIEALTLTNGIGHNAEDYTADELKVPTLEQYLSICREYGMIAFIELKVSDVPSFLEIYEIIKAMGMQERCVISAGNGGGILKNVRFFTELPVWNITPPSTDYPVWRAIAGSGVGIDVTYDDLENHPEVPDLVQEMLSSQMKVALRACDTIENAVTALKLGLSIFNSNSLRPVDFEQLKLE